MGKKEPRMVSHTGRINWCCRDDQSEAQELHLYLRVFKARRPAVRRSSRNLLSACGCRFQRHASFSCNGHGFKTTAKCTQQEQLEGLEPSFPAWKAGTLPLCYSRINGWNKFALSQPVISGPKLHPRYCHMPFWRVHSRTMRSRQDRPSRLAFPVAHSRALYDFFANSRLAWA
jgi:hypothetical protein